MDATRWLLYRGLTLILSQAMNRMACNNSRWELPTNQKIEG